MQTPNVKQEARHLVESLPDGATWDDLMYTIYVRQAIEAGLEDSEAGRGLDVNEVRVVGVKVHWTNTAVQHLLAIYAHIARDAPRYGQRMIARLTDRSE